MSITQRTPPTLTPTVRPAPPVARTRKPAPRRRSRAGSTAVFVVIGIAASMVFTGPLVIAFLRSLEPGSAVASVPTLDDLAHLSFSNYIGIFTQLNLLQYVGNSLLVAVGGSLLTAVLATLAGYGLGRFEFRGQGIVFALLLVAMMVPFQALLTPIYLEFNAVGLTDNLVGLVLFYGTFHLPFGVFVMRNTFASMPRELEEAAAMDGASIMGTLWRVLRPLALPGVASVILFTFLDCWSEFIGAFTFLSSDDKFTLPIALLSLFQGAHGQIDYGLLIAGAVISMIPSVALYLALQRYYVQGMVAGAVRG